MANDSPGAHPPELKQVHEIRLNGTQLVLVLISAAVLLALPFVRAVPVAQVLPAWAVFAAGETQPVSAAAGPTDNGGLEPGPPDATLAQIATPELVAAPGRGRGPTAARLPASAASTPLRAATVVGPVLTIQVKASRVRSEADAMAQRLVGKGFEAYVTALASGGQPLFRVRVGKFSERGEAYAAVARLSAEEQLDTWLVQLPPETAPRVDGR